jgi:competence protein ComEC
LLILPLAFVIMQVGVPLMLFGWIPVLGEILGWLLSWLIWGQNWIAETIRMIPGGKVDRLTMDFSGMILVWGLLLIAASWKFGPKRKLTWLAMFLIFFWVGSQLYSEVKTPSKELIVYQGKKSQLIDLSGFGTLNSWNLGLEAGEISYSVDPNRIQSGWPQIPESLSAFQQDSENLAFVGADFTFYPKEKKLNFLQVPKSIHYWSEGKWNDLPTSNSLVIDSMAYRILF